MFCSSQSARWHIRFIKPTGFVLVLLSYMSVSIGNLSAQNSSLFHKPVAHLAQAGNPAGSGEVLPAPLVPRGAGQLNSEFNPQPGPNFPQQSNMNAFQGGYFPSAMDNAGQLGLQTSWSYVPPAPARSLKLHDIVSIRIEETSTSLATGNATSRKTTSYDASIKEWLRLVGLDTIKPAPQSDGDPRVQTSQTEVYRGDSTIRTSEAFTRNIAAEIVDIKPNGLIVLDATKVIEENDNSWRYSLTGTCRSQDIDPNNVVLSRNLIQSHIKKQDLGHVRDGYSRGWLTKLLARIKPF
jgi:flagellar L-ring protein precursor FlgH